VVARLQLRVSAGARGSAVVGRHGDAWKVRVAPPPEDGKANAAVVRLLADALGLGIDDVVIVSGHSSRDKTVTLHGIDQDEIDRRLTTASGAREE
jgi:uncharacterized protein